MSKSLLGRSVWESFISRFAGSRRPTRRRQALAKAWNSGVAAESLEQRLVPTITTSFALGTLTIVGDGADTIVVKAGSSYTDVTANGAFVSRVNSATSNSISTIAFQGGTGADSLEIRGTNQAITVTLTGGVETLKLTSTKSATVTSTVSLDLGVSNVSGDLTVTATPVVNSTTANITQTAGKVSVSGIASFTANGRDGSGGTLANFGDITLTNVGNSFGSLKLGGTAVQVKEAGSTDLGLSTALGALTVTSTGAITDSGKLIVGGVATFTATRNAITLDDPTSTFASSLVLTGTNVAVRDADAGGVDLGTTKVSGSLTVKSADVVVQSGTVGITVGGLMTITAVGKNITLDESALTGGAGRNNFGSVSFDGADVLLKERSSTVLAESTATGVLNLQSGGSVTDSGDLTIGGTTTIIGVGGAGLIAITLDQPDSKFTGALILSGSNIAVTNSLSTGTVIGTTTATGTFSLTSAGDVTEEVPATTLITVGGRATINATAADGTKKNVTLDGTTADKYGSIGIDGAVVKLRESDDTDLYTTTTTGNLTVISGGNITDRGDVVVGTSTTTATTALTTGTAKSITLNSTGSEYSGAISVTNTDAKNVAITNVLSTVLGGIDITGTLNVTSLGVNATNLGISQSSTLKVDGRATFTATDSDITLSGANEFGSISFDGENVTLNEADATNGSNLFTSTAKGNFQLTSTGDITDSGTLTIIGNTTLSNAGKNITLDSGASTFAGNVLLTSKDVILKDNDLLGLTLGASTLTGTLNLTAKGDITDAGLRADAVTVTGATAATFVANNGGDITLDSISLAANTTTLSLTGDNATVDLRATGVDLGATTLTGALTLTATGAAVTDSGKLVVAGTVDINATGFALTLDSVGNSFGSLLLKGTVVTINEAAATDLGTSTASTSLTVTSSGSITDSGVLSSVGATSLTSNGGSIILNEPTSTFGNLTLKGADITLTDSNATVLDKVTASGDFTLKSGGTVTQSGATLQANAASVGGAVSVTTTDALVTLDNKFNSFGTVAIDSKSTGTTGAAVTIVENGDTDLSTITATTVDVTSYGAITDTALGKLTATGTTTLTTKSSGAISLDRANSALTGALILTGSNIAITNTLATTIGATTAHGTFTLVSGDDVTSSAAITVDGLATITAKTLANVDKAITLGAGGLKFGSISLTGSNASFTETDATDLFTSALSGTLTVTSGGKITDSGTLTVTGAVTLSATAAFDILLDQSLSTFGTLSLTGKDVAVTEDAATDITLISAAGTLTITSSGQITDAGASGSTMSAGGQVIIKSTAPLDGTGGAGTFAIELTDLAATRTGAGFTAPFVAPLTAPQFIALSQSIATV